MPEPPQEVRIVVGPDDALPGSVARNPRQSPADVNQTRHSKNQE